VRRGSLGGSNESRGDIRHRCRDINDGTRDLTAIGGNCLIRSVRGERSQLRTIEDFVVVDEEQRRSDSA